MVCSAPGCCGIRQNMDVCVCCFCMRYLYFLIPLAIWDPAPYQASQSHYLPSFPRVQYPFCTYQSKVVSLETFLCSPPSSDSKYSPRPGSLGYRGGRPQTNPQTNPMLFALGATKWSGCFPPSQPRSTGITDHESPLKWRIFLNVQAGLPEWPYKHLCSSWNKSPNLCLDRSAFSRWCVSDLAVGGWNSIWGYVITDVLTWVKQQNDVREWCDT